MFGRKRVGGGVEKIFKRIPQAVAFDSAFYTLMNLAEIAQENTSFLSLPFHE
jgi:hypothetical protein